MKNDTSTYLDIGYSVNLRGVIFLNLNKNNYSGRIYMKPAFIYS